MEYSELKLPKQPENTFYCFTKDEGLILKQLNFSFRRHSFFETLNNDTLESLWSYQSFSMFRGCFFPLVFNPHGFFHFANKVLFSEFLNSVLNFQKVFYIFNNDLNVRFFIFPEVVVSLNIKTQEILISDHDPEAVLSLKKHSLLPKQDIKWKQSRELLNQMKRNRW